MPLLFACVVCLLCCDSIEDLHLLFSWSFFSMLRLISVEDGLRRDRQELQSAVEQKDHIIEAQEKRIESLDVANVRLLAALNSLQDRYPRSGVNGITSGPTKLTLADASQFRSSSC